MIKYCALAPHPPLIVPGISDRDLGAVGATIAAMKELARTVAEQRPKTLVFFTPHGNVYQDAVSILNRSELEGSLAQFGRGDLHYRHPNDKTLLARIAQRALEADLPVVLVDEKPNDHRLNPNLDHGILVPLHYLEAAGLKDIPLVAISVGYLSLEELYRFGMAVRDAAAEVGREIAVIASGDMSHRLKSDGPYTYHPDGPVFDSAIAKLMAAGDLAGIFNLDEKTRDNAGECGFRSIVMMMGTLNTEDFAPRVYSYEGPFGVGYLVAGLEPNGVLRDDYYQILQQQKAKDAADRRAAESELVAWARQSLEAYVKDGSRVDLPKQLSELLGKRAAAFVSLKKNGQLRGCIGTLAPVRPNLAAEIRENAISAGTQDPRFLPVTRAELDELVYSVDVLGEPELITSMDELDPKRYGVIVRAEGKSGVLLPDLEGIDRAEKQVEIALEKAGIGPAVPYQMERFEVRRHK